MKDLSIEKLTALTLGLVAGSAVGLLVQAGIRNGFDVPARADVPWSSSRLLTIPDPWGQTGNETEIRAVNTPAGICVLMIARVGGERRYQMECTNRFEQR